MNEIEKKINDLEAQNKLFYREIKQLEKQTLGLLWLWFLLPLVGHFIYITLKVKRITSEPYHSNIVRIKVEIAKNEIEIIKLKKILSK